MAMKKDTKKSTPHDSVMISSVVKSTLLRGELGDLPLVGQEAHDRRDRAANHNDQIDDKDEMQDLILAGNSGETPVAELQREK